MLVVLTALLPLCFSAFSRKKKKKVKHNLKQKKRVGIEYSLVYFYFGVHFMSSPIIPIPSHKAHSAFVSFVCCCSVPNTSEKMVGTSLLNCSYKKLG